MNWNSAESIASSHDVSLERAQHWLTEAQNHQQYPQWFIDMSQWKHKNSYYRFINDYYKACICNPPEQKAQQETTSPPSNRDSQRATHPAFTPYRQQSVGRVQRDFRSDYFRELAGAN